MEKELNAEHRTPNAERRTAAVTRIRARLLIPLALAVVFSALWVATLAGSQAWLVRAQARVDAAHAAAVPAEEGERAANALWRAEKATALLRLVPTQFALEHFENAWINATPEAQERYILRFGLPHSGIAGFVFGLLIAFWRRLRLPLRLALLALLLHPVLYCATFAWSQRGSDSPAFWLLFRLLRPYDALLAALSWEPADILVWRTDRAVLDTLVYVASATVVGSVIRRTYRRGGTMRTRLLAHSIVMLALATVLQGCGGGEETLASWRAPGGKLKITVTQRPSLIKNHTSFVVRTAQETSTTEIDDDMRFGTLRILRYGNWYLIGNDGYVVAGFDAQKTLVALQGQWDLLPFREWEAHRDAIEVLVTKKIGECALPGGYWIDPDPASRPASRGGADAP